MFSSRCFSSSIKLLSELQVQVLELICGPKVSPSAEPGSQRSPGSAARTEASSSWAAPGYTRDSCWAGSLNQDQQEPWASSNWQQSQRHPKQGLTPMLRNCTGHSIPAARDAQHTPAPHSNPLPWQHRAGNAAVLYKHKQNEWGWLLVLFNDSALRISTELTPWCHMWSFQARAAVHWWGSVENPELPQLSPRVNGGWHTPALSSKHPSKNQLLIWLMQSTMFLQ